MDNPSPPPPPNNPPREGSQEIGQRVFSFAEQFMQAASTSEIGQQIQRNLMAMSQGELRQRAASIGSQIMAQIPGTGTGGENLQEVVQNLAHNVAAQVDIDIGQEQIIENFPSREEIDKAVNHETRLAVLGSVALNVIWWFTVYIVGIQFPMMHIALLLGLNIITPSYDRTGYPMAPPTRVYSARAVANLTLLLLCLVLVGPLGMIFQTQVPSGIFSFLMSSIAISGIISIMRLFSNVSLIMTKYITKGQGQGQGQPPLESTQSIHNRNQNQE